MGDLWYKNAVIYCLAVETFMDGDGDGVGDFEGLLSRLDYLGWLGVDCLWLEPFFPSPWNDHGYDVADYRAVDPRLGTLEQFERLTREELQSGKPIIVRQFPAERATIDSSGTNGPTLTINGAWAWYWGFEIMNSSTNRANARATAPPIDPPPP